jgi:hypothetical protein
MLTHRPLASAVLAVFVLLALTGCITETTQGGATVFRYEGWLGPLAIFFGVVAVVVGYFLCEYDKRLGFALLVIPPFLLLLFVPNCFLDQVKVDDDHFEMRSGWWWEPTRTNLRFADLERMDYFEEEQRGHRPGFHYIVYLECVDKDGEHFRIDLDELGFEAVGAIMTRAGAQGVTVPSLEEAKLPGSPP